MAHLSKDGFAQVRTSSPLVKRVRRATGWFRTVFRAVAYKIAGWRPTVWSGTHRANRQCQHTAILFLTRRTQDRQTAKAAPTPVPAGVRRSGS